MNLVSNNFLNICKLNYEPIQTPMQEPEKKVSEQPKIEAPSVLVLGTV